MLRGINVGSARRIPMADLRGALGDAGFPGAATHGQSGNVGLDSGLAPTALERASAELIAERFELEVPVTARTGEELAAILAHDPIPGAGRDPKRYQVTFLAVAPDPEPVAVLAARAVGEERVLAHGRELYSWHPDGIARSKLAAALTGREFGAGATVRNWSTVTRLHELASRPPA